MKVVSGRHHLEVLRTAAEASPGPHPSSKKPFKSPYTEADTREETAVSTLGETNRWPDPAQQFYAFQVFLFLIYNTISCYQ